jgi:hypothetical protein|nr:MAG TPA: hypothetical protein [Caudoviricetes sp.]
MISHIVKKMLDEVTGLTFQPIHSEKAWYSLTPIQRDYINIDTLEVRIVTDDFDELENYRMKVESLINKQHESNHLKDGYSLRFSVSGGGILPLQDFELYDSTQYLQITWYRKRG